jgi:hypothetical protein
MRRRTTLFYKGILLLVSLCVVFVQVARANTLTTAGATISDSRAGRTATTHSFTFTTATTATIKTIDFQYCTTFSGACTGPSGLVLGSALGSVSGVGAGTAVVASNTVTYTITSATSVNSGTAISVPFTNVTNPTGINTSSFVRITTKDNGAATIDTATVAFAVLDTNSLAVSASIDPTFTFTVAGVNSGGTVNGATTNISTTATSIPFGVLSSGSTKIAAHDLSVTTNALNGYTITVKGATSPVLNSGAQNIDEFTGTNASPSTWSSPAGSSASVNTGFFGYTTNDATLGTGTANRFTSGGTKWAGTTTSPLEIAFSSAGITSEVTRVGWQAEVNAIQPQGSYSGTVIIVATPSY